MQAELPSSPDWKSVQGCIATGRYSDALVYASSDRNMAEDLQLRKMFMLARTHGANALRRTNDLALLQLRVIAEDPARGDPETASLVQQVLEHQEKH